MKKIIILFFLTTFSLNSQILSEKNRAVKINEILKNRFENVLPELMDKTGIESDFSKKLKQVSASLTTEASITYLICFIVRFRFFNFSLKISRKCSLLFVANVSTRQL